MNNLQLNINNYLDYCKHQKNLDCKTLKAYRIDLNQFYKIVSCTELVDITTYILENYVSTLNCTYKAKTVKRKLASTKSFFNYLEFKNIIQYNPFDKMHIKIREPQTLPKTIPLDFIKTLLSKAYEQIELAPTKYKRRNALRDVAVMELLFATGLRISELCSLKSTDINLTTRNILIMGKGSKQRLIQIGNDEVLKALINYKEVFNSEIQSSGYFFANQTNTNLSDQSVRRMLIKYCNMCHIDYHITPHMFRHTFATCLLDADVDIRYIQNMLGHSSISITEIYTHVSMSKQLDILSSKHPRNNFSL